MPAPSIGLVVPPWCAVYLVWTEQCVQKDAEARSGLQQACSNRLLMLASNTHLLPLFQTRVKLNIYIFYFFEDRGIINILIIEINYINQLKCSIFKTNSSSSSPLTEVYASTFISDNSSGFHQHSCDSFFALHFLEPISHQVLLILPFSCISNQFSSLLQLPPQSYKSFHSHPNHHSFSHLALLPPVLHPLSFSPS